VDSSDLPNISDTEGFRIVHSDNAKEYQHIENDYANKDITKSDAAPYTPEHNSIAERVNRTIMVPAGSMLIHA
jgi:transposase InsO family protein